MNPYAYCLGNPINKNDPTGHFSWPAWLPRLKSIHVPSRNPFNSYWTKPWHSKRTAYKTASEADNLISRADKLTLNARNAALDSDIELAFSFNAPYQPNHLERAAYKTLRPGDYKTLPPEYNVFSHLEKIATHYGGETYATFHLLAQAELSDYRPILTKLNAAYPDVDMLSRFSNWTKRSSDLAERSYFERMQSIQHPEAQKLYEKANKIRSKVFK